MIELKITSNTDIEVLADILKRSLAIDGIVTWITVAIFDDMGHITNEYDDELQTDEDDSV